MVFKVGGWTGHIRGGKDMYYVTPDEIINTPAAVAGAVASFEDVDDAIFYARQHADQYHYGLAVVDGNGRDVQDED